MKKMSRGYVMVGLCAAGLAVAITGCSDKSDESPATLPKNQPPEKVTPCWSNNWDIFVTELATVMDKNNYFIDNVNEAFSGKQVVWEGRVVEIESPPFVRIGMTPMNLRGATLERLLLRLTDSEWDTWKEVSVGDVITFTTTLDKGILRPECVLAWMQGMGPNAGKTTAWVNAKGGKCLRINPKNTDVPVEESEKGGK